MSDDYSKGSPLNPYSHCEEHARKYHEEVNRLNDLAGDERWYVSWENWVSGPTLREMNPKEMWELKDRICELEYKLTWIRRTSEVVPA